MTHVLVVDDHENGRTMLEDLFRGHGWSVAYAGNGEEALSLAREAKPDLIVSDLLMPVMDGYTLLRRIRADPDLCRTRFVVYTATFTDPADARLSIALGADAYILKPHEPISLFERCDQIVAEGPRAHPDAVDAGDPEDQRLLTEHNTTLVRKLEKKSSALESALRSLTKSESHLRTIIECGPDCMSLLAPDGKVLQLNAAGVIMLDADALPDLMGKSLDSLVLPEDRSAFVALREDVMRGATGRMEFAIKSLTGHDKWLELHAAPLRNEAGESVAMIGIMRDVTERRRTQETLREAAERLEQVVVAGGVGLWDWDLRSNHVTFSLEWKRQLGHEDGEVADDVTEWSSRLHPEDRARAEAVVAEYLAGDLPYYESEFRMRHKDGSYRRILARGAAVRDASGARIALRGSHIDITQRAELQAQLMQSQKMESVGLLAAGVAHDFNNVLSVILGIAERATRVREPSDPSAADFTTIRDAARRAVALTRQLLAFSRRSLDRPEILDLNALIEDVVALFVTRLGQGLECRLELARPLPPIFADRGQIEQMMVNLAVNARDAMPEGGTLSIKTTVSPKQGHASGVRLEFSDTGTGMDSATQSRIFEPFFTTKVREHGTGLGLSTVFGIVGQCGATIDVKSALGEGTTFTIEFPPAPAA